MNAAENDYRTRVVHDLDDLSEADWTGLLDADARRRGTDAVRHPFLRLAFLRSLQRAGCTEGDTGWDAEFMTLRAGGRLVAAAPMWRKFHSYGEYVFDWAWADAHHRHGLPYYPKLLVAIPFTPVPGPRLLAAEPAAHEALAGALLDHARRSDVSSLHVLLPEEDDLASLADAGLLLRDGVQFHWSNPGWKDFDDYLAALAQPKRKKIRAERRRVHEAGVRCRVLPGTALDAAHLRFLHRCYARTYRAHGGPPYLNADFFARWIGEAPGNVLLSLAERDGEPIACALLARGGDRIFGRYWGCVVDLPCLHFETAYYAPIEHAIANGIRVFEGGAQGEHKLSRGFAPVRTRSAHWLAHPAFSDAVERFLERERGGVDAYLDELSERLPLRAQAGGDTDAAAGPDGASDR